MAALGNRQRWGWAAGGAVLAAVAIASLFRSPRLPEPMVARPTSGGPALVRLVNLRKDEAVLTDPTPLFLPTEWNAGQNALPDNARQEAGTSFTGYPAKLKFADTELGLEFPADIAVPARPSDALALGKLGQTFLGLESDSTEITQLIARKAFVEIVAAGSGERVFAQPVSDASPPGGGDWQPMEFLVAVDAMGLVGPPILTESSRVPAVDGYFQNYLIKTLRAGERLAPGFYRICVGP